MLEDADIARLVRVDPAACIEQTRGTRYTAGEQMRRACATGGAAARESLYADPAGAMRELSEHVGGGGTLASWCRGRGLAYSTAERWIARDAERAREYEAARDARTWLLADQVMKIADESTASTPAAARHDWERMKARMLLAERLMPGRFGRRLTEVHAVDFPPDRRRVKSGKFKREGR